MKTKKSRNHFLVEVLSRSPLPFSKASFDCFAGKILADLKIKRAHLSILFVKDAAMRKFNCGLMKDPRTTDVISISQIEEPQKIKEPNPLNSLGDIIVCLDTAKRQAKRLGCSYKEELCRYAVHGILHCLGYDDLKSRDRDKMWALQEKLVKKYKHLLK